MGFEVSEPGASGRTGGSCAGMVKRPYTAVCHDVDTHATATGDVRSPGLEAIRNSAEVYRGNDTEWHPDRVELCQKRAGKVREALLRPLVAQHAAAQYRHRRLPDRQRRAKQSQPEVEEPACTSGVGTIVLVLVICS